MTFKTKTIGIAQVFLDNENPRHDPIDNEPEIIHKLVATEGVRVLAADIVAHGLSPLERMAVIAHPTVKNRFVAVEGNRRLCALKLLSDPEKAPNEPARKAFRALRAKRHGSLPNIEAAVFDSREDARHWLELRHEGPLGGAGTKPWNTAQKARFNSSGRGDNPNALALNLVEYAAKRNLISQAERGQMSLTTLTRYLSNPLVRDALGLASNRQVATRGKQAEFDRAATRFLKDSLDPKSGVSSRSKKVDREAYASKLRSEGFTPAQVSKAVTKLDPNAKGKPAAKPSAPRDSRNPRDRPNVVPTDFKSPIKDKILRRIYGELKEIDTYKFPFAASYLFRAFVELTVHIYCTKYGLPYNDRNQAGNILTVEADLQKRFSIDQKVTKEFRVMGSSKDALFSPDTIGNAIHGGAVADRHRINDGWDNIEPVIKILLEKIN